MDGSGCWHCGGARFAAECTQSGQQQKGGIRSLCGLKECEHINNPTGACHGDSDLQLDRINSDGSSEDSDLQLDRINSDGSSEPLVHAGSVSNWPAGIGIEEMDKDLFKVFWKTNRSYVADISTTTKLGTESFYPVRREKITNGDQFCNNSKHLEIYKGCNRFGCLEDYVESGDEGIDDFGFENSDVEMFHFHLDKDRRDKTGRGNVSFPSVKEQAVKRSYSQVVSGLGSDSDGFQRVASKKEKKEARKVSSLGIRMPEGLKSVEEAPEWEVLEMAVDSGASESVVSDEMLTRVTTVEGEAMKKGVQYEVADGTLIPNLGEKKFIAVSDNGVARQMRAQVCEVNKALLSVHRVVQAGNRVVFAASGSYVEDEQTGETMELVEKGGMYMLKLWVKAQGFSGLNEA